MERGNYQPQARQKSAAQLSPELQATREYERWCGAEEEHFVSAPKKCRLARL
jgi:hypothetical protein